MHQQLPESEFGAPQTRFPDQRPLNNPYAHPGGYGASGPVPYYPQPKRGLSISSLILGIAGLIFGVVMIVQLVGLILGIVALGKEPQARGMAITGIVLNGITFVGWLLVIIFFFVLVAAAASQGY